MGHGNGDLIGNYAIRSVGKRHPAAGLLTTTTNLSKFAIEIALSKQASRQLAKSGDYAQNRVVSAMAIFRQLSCQGKASCVAILKNDEHDAD